MSAALDPIEPTITLDRLHPPRTAFTPRAQYADGPWVFLAPFRVDSAAGLALPVTGAMPAVCHEQLLTRSARQFFEQCGVQLDERLASGLVNTYATEEQAYALASGLADAGYRLAGPYPIPADRIPPGAALVPNDLYGWLNDKANLAELVAPVDARLLPPFVLLDPDDTAGLLDAFGSEAVFVKACVAGACGSGVDIRYCVDEAARRAAIAWLAGGPPHHAVRVERALDLRTGWGMTVAVLDDTVAYVGSAMQLIERPGEQCGSRVDPACQPPVELVEASVAVADDARRRGYRGVAGFDVAVTTAGAPVMFDLNFRMVSSTPQLLLHESATGRVGTAVSDSFDASVDGPLEAALERLTPFGERGEFVPIRLWEASEASDNISLITGMVVGDTPAHTTSLAHQLRHALAVH